MPVDLPKRTFTVDEYHAIAAAGIFERERVELVEGEVVAMAANGSRHSACVTRLTALILGRVGDSAIVRVQEPLRLSDRTELEPDIAIVRRRQDYYATAHPSAADTLLAIEVAESSLAYDRDVKLPLYAGAGVPEAWLVDLAKRQVRVLTEPSVEGYRLTVIKSPADTIEDFAGLSVALLVDELLP